MNLPITPKRFLTSIVIMAMVGISTVSLTNSGGAPGGYTNAPGENNCTSCHSGTLQTQTSTYYSNISLTSNFTGNGYIPDSTYSITLKYVHSGKSKFGFQLTCLNPSNGMAGSFSNSTTRTSTTSATISGATRSYVRHTSSGNSGTDSISWTFDWTAPSTNVDTVTFYSIINSANGSGTGGDIIIAREFKIAPSTLLPVATAAAADSTPCQFTNVGLLGSGTNNPTSYHWTLTGGSPSASNSQNPNVNYISTGVKRAILVVKNAKGSSLPDTVELDVQPGPSSFVFGTPTRTICDGDSVKLEVAAQSGNTYVWSTGETGTSIYAKDTAVYYVDAISSNGCSKRSNLITVQYHPKETATLTSGAAQFGDSSCDNSIINLSMTSGANADSFFYFRNDTLVDKSTANTASTNFFSTARFTGLVKDNNGCFSDSAHYDVVGSPRLAAPVVACKNQTSTSVRFEWDGSGFHDGFQVSTNNGLSWSFPSSGQNGSYHDMLDQDPNDSIELWVRALDGAPCFSSATAKLTCITDTCSLLEATVKFNDRLCHGELLNVEVNGLSGTNYGLTIDGGGAFKDTIFSFNPSITNTYVVSVYDSNHLACPANELEMPVIVDRILNIDLKSDKFGAYCEGETVTYSANDTIETFDFYLNGTLVQSGSSNSYSSITMSNADSIYVIVTNGVCVDTSEVELVKIEGPSDASFSYSRAGSVYTFTPTLTSFSTYAWDFGDGSAIDNSIIPTHDYAAKEGEDVFVTLEVTSDNNCVSDSVEVLSLPVFSSVEDIENSGIRVFPNPVEDFITISDKLGRSGVVEIFSLTGQKVGSYPLKGPQSTLDIKDIEQGIYMLKVNFDDQEYSFKIHKH